MRENLNLIVVTALMACGASQSPSQSPSRSKESLPTPTTSESPQELASRAMALLLGDSGPQDRKRALDLYFESCRGGVSQSCVLVMTADGFTNEQQGVGAEILWSRCKAGDMWSCRIASASDHQYFMSDLKKARVACERGLSYACTGVAKSTKDSGLLGKACEMGDPSACALAEKVRPADRTHWQDQRRQLVQRGCEEGAWPDCKDFMKLLATGPEKSAISDRANALVVQSCLEGDGQACGTSSWTYDETVELRLRRLNCALQPSGSCRILAKIYLSDQVNPIAARRAYEMSCLADTKDSTTYERKSDDCIDGAVVSRGIEGGGTRAEIMLKIACSLGEPRACDGTAIPTDRP